ncbi:integrase [Sphingobium indicum]|nr:integrase [Sphingobium indicum]
MDETLDRGMTASIVIVHRPDDGAGSLPKRRGRGDALPANARLLRTIVAALPADFAPVSQLGVETALEAMAEATMLAIAADLDCFLAWARAERRPPLPAEPEDLVRYVRHLEAIGRKPSVASRRISSIANLHRLVGLGEKDPLPTDHAMVRNALRAHRRRRGAAQRQAAPMRFGGALGDDTGFTISHLLEACDGDLQGLRDGALLSLAYDGGLRVSELNAARVDHLEPQGDGSGLLFIPRSKTDQEAEGAWAWVSPDSMRRIQLWLVESGIEDGPLFRRVGVDRRRARAAIPPQPYL